MGAVGAAARVQARQVHVVRVLLNPQTRLIRAWGRVVGPVTVAITRSDRPAGRAPFATRVSIGLAAAARRRVRASRA